MYVMLGGILMKHFFQQTTEEVLSNLGTTIDGLNDAKVEEQRAT